MSSPRGVRVLVVDHAPAVLNLMTSTLRCAGFSVQAAYSAADALSVIQRYPEAVDVLLSDVAMPGMTGLELADRARRLAPRLPIILMSGLADAMQRPAAFSPAAIIAMIESVSQPARKAPSHETRRTAGQSVRTA